MRGYWLKIALGAAAVFAVGMFVVGMFDMGRSRVEEIAEGTGPISFPLAFVPFDLDGERVGTLRRVTVFRDSVQRPTSIELSISVADSAVIERLGACVLAIQEANAQGNYEPHRYRCLAAVDTAGRDLVAFGELSFRDHDGPEFPLHAPRAVVEEVKGNFGPSAEASDSILADSAEQERDRIEALADSMTEAAESLHQREMERIDSIRRAAEAPH
jgi:hypothetical protein